MKKLIFCFGLLISAINAYAIEDKYHFDSVEREQTFKELTHELRCPKCQNQNIADSDAVVAKDLRDKVLTLVHEGKSKDEVIDYMIDRYGYFVHYQPPVTPLTILLWVLPGLIVALGFGFIVVRQRKSAQVQPWTDADETKLAALIAKYEQREQQ
ncbi:cytochrome c-type biogenesis protein CcmH [Pseudoalteromonas xiamenensis]|uniref:cytochrome c-type biogenesis protein n=1 Tax=Pseudoalteromonas xiamenensis TaxID=882626 RepID=UPI0027E49526|nr:cytochrome c-type biogenesis protein CcmH [Pseudoalteromonas xiamenensis]WMN59426.1 cytochrome c-type biogenesis protein CcmH [Pseudoalteromonas xiamenensis]